MNKFRNMTALLGTCLIAYGVAAQSENSAKTVMTELIVPNSTTIWGAYDLQSDQEWKSIETAALAMLEAGRQLEMLDPDPQTEGTGQWRMFNEQMVSATQQVLAAISAKDEEALFNAGNDALYPPCEACHRVYQAQ